MVGLAGSLWLLLPALEKSEMNEGEKKEAKKELGELDNKLDAVDKS